MSNPSTVDSLSATITRTTAALDLAGQGSQDPWRFTRCWLLETRFEEFGRSLADLDLALSDFDTLPERTVGRARLAGVLATAHVRAALMTDPVRFQRALSLAQIANDDPDPLPGWPAVAAVIRSFALMQDIMNGRPGFGTAEAEAEIDELAKIVGAMEPHATQIELARFAIDTNALFLKHGTSNAEQLARRMQALAGRLRANGISTPQFEYMTMILEAHQAMDNYDVTKLAGLLDTFKNMRDRLPEDHRYRTQLDALLRQLEPMLHLFMPGGPMDPARWAPGMPPAPVTSAPPIAAPPDPSGVASPQEEATKWNAAGMREFMADPGSLERIDIAIKYLTRAIEVSPEHDPRRPSYLMALGHALLTRYELRPQAPDLAAATQRLEQARALAGVESHHIWTLCANSLAHAYRLAGRRDLGRQVALSGLRGHAWNALLHTRSTDFSDAMTDPADAAIDVARWCLSDGDAAAASSALDAGRGLVLYAAMEHRNVEARLQELGEGELAAAWATAQAAQEHEVPLGLRQRVIAVLSGIQEATDAGEGDTAGQRQRGLDNPTHRLLDTPDLHEVRAALGALNVDVLVYLMPGDDGPGAAVIVPAKEHVSHVLLPRLNRVEIKNIDQSLLAVSRQLVRSTPQEEHQTHRDLVTQSRQRVDDVGGWAWDAAIGPLIERYLTMPPDRPLRMILIPMRELCRIPWHAARRTVAGEHEYALSRVRFSYMPSARMLCDSAWRPSGPSAERQLSTLIVADPDTGGKACDLPAARAEAQAIREAFYPSASYLGRADAGHIEPDGEGTLDQVTAWLKEPSGRSILHLAVHGVATHTPGATETSYLMLAGDPGRLSAEMLVNTLAQTHSCHVDLAVLAGCRTGETTRGFDEAFSIGTALLASGVRSVISSQWSIPDSPTSILMFLFHYYLRSGDVEAADALRQAQLTILENRPMPTAMPEVLRNRAADHDVSDILNWAAFFHSGR